MYWWSSQYYGLVQKDIQTLRYSDQLSLSDYSRWVSDQTRFSLDYYLQDASCSSFGGDNFILPQTAEEVEAALDSAVASEGPAYCGRAARIGYDGKKAFASSKNAIQVGGSHVFFQKKKFDILCDRYTKDKKLDGVYM